MFRIMTTVAVAAVLAAGAGAPAQAQVQAQGELRPFSPNHDERLLAAAGFQATPATSPAAIAELSSLRRRHLLAEPDGDQLTYVYADPRGCNCIWRGDALAMRNYQNEVAREQSAQAYMAAADARWAYPRWGGFGAYPAYHWGRWGGPVVIRGGFGHFGHFRR